MKIFILILTISLMLVNTNELSAHKRAKYNIVIDTDGGSDDFRAITCFTASKDFNINCITTVDGVLAPETGAEYISKTLQIYHHEGIPVGAGSDYKASKKYAKHASLYWKNLFPEIDKKDFRDAVELLDFSIKNEKKRTIIIAAGPLSNIAEMLEKYPENAAKTEMILWYSEWSTKPEGYNYEQNKDAYDKIIESKVPLKIISGNGMSYPGDFLGICKEINSVYSQTMFRFLSSQDNNKIWLWDEMLALYLLYPTLFDEEPVAEYCRKVTPKADSYFDILITGILNSDKPEPGVVFNEIPSSGYMLINDVNDVAAELIANHGYTEFKITSLASEIHSHMGIYSILGAKTGLRIMEYLHAGLDEIEIISYAGFDPPVSCFNDGLQVGTGSTIGYGTISVDTTQSIKPAVLVKYNGREILFSLKPEIIAKIRKDVGGLIKTYGLESELYWKKLREISISEYWLKMSRYEILDITVIE